MAVTFDLKEIIQLCFDILKEKPLLILNLNSVFFH